MPPKVVSKKTHSGKFTSTALSTGGEFYAKNKGESMYVVDKSNAQRSLKSAPASKGDLSSFDMFVPADPSSSGVGSGQRKSAKSLHSDPFAQDRTHAVAPVKKLLAVEQHERHATGRQHVRPLVKDGASKEQVITANGLVAGGGKHFDKRNLSSRTTFNNVEASETPKKVDYSKTARFKNRRQSGAGEGGPISPNSRDTGDDEKKFVSPEPKAKLHTKRVAGAPDMSKSLVGVLKAEDKRPARSYNYRPPWGTCSTPRSTVPAGRATHTCSAPWASDAPAAPATATA